MRRQLGGEVQDKKDELHLLSFAHVLEHAGITRLVLHAWERRYGIEPQSRTETGRRLYTFAQAERLRRLKLCSDAGYRIGNLVNLSDEELLQLEKFAEAERAIMPALEALKAREFERLERWLFDRAQEQSVVQLIEETVSPLQFAVGDQWAAARLSIAEEHFVTATIKRVLSGILDGLPQPEAAAPWLLATTPEGEHHELGALCVAVLAKHEGWNVLYLGPNLPSHEIVEISTRHRIRCVCLSSLAAKPKDIGSKLRELRQLLPAHIDLWTGGKSFGLASSVENVEHFSTLAGFRAALKQSGI